MNELDDILDEAPFYIEQVGIRQVREKVYYSSSRISSPREAVDVFAEEIRFYDREVVGIVNVDASMRPLNVNICSIGSLDRAIVSPRELLKTSILSNASGVVMIHNHPSGNVEPSEQDIVITHRMASVYKLMGIALLDHIIVGQGDVYYSFSENKELPKNEITFEKKLDEGFGLNL
ncbi:MAG: JAB domain-containing protein [Eubacterium sp.]|nr:JAB domain-containing protein [Eubacterium sp.]